MASEREYPVATLSAGPLAPGLRDPLMRLLEGFEPLEFKAAEKAKAWLETSVSAGNLGFDTHLAFSEDGERLFGFFAVGEEDVQVAPGDIPAMVVRKTIDDPEAETQHAMQLVWIARSRESNSGFGDELFNHALVLGMEAGACALTVEPYDEPTEKKLWLEHFHFRKPRKGSSGWTRLWFPVGKANQDFC